MGGSFYYDGRDDYERHDERDDGRGADAGSRRAYYGAGNRGGDRRGDGQEHNAL